MYPPGVKYEGAACFLCFESEKNTDSQFFIWVSVFNSHVYIWVYNKSDSWHIWYIGVFVIFSVCEVWTSDSISYLIFLPALKQGFQKIRILGANLCEDNVSKNVEFVFYENIFAPA